ncbi:MAG: hypothetical protein KGJ13_00670 [Patescibacteria group bacterium]|nr:hypothetical protein [Patescibacteria group bacterium]
MENGEWRMENGEWRMEKIEDKKNGSMFKKIIIGVIIVIIAAALLAWFFPRENPTTGGGNTAGGTAQSFEIPAQTSGFPTGATIAIGTPHGTVTVNNFYKTTTLSEEEYLIFGKTPDYELLYNPNNGAFVVSISAGPLSKTRPEAEAALLSALGIGKAEACKLSVTVGVAAGAVPNLAGQPLLLSFCSAGGVIQ